jgi:hypothetical protein
MASFISEIGGRSPTGLSGVAYGSSAILVRSLGHGLPSALVA